MMNILGQFPMQNLFIDKGESKSKHVLFELYDEKIEFRGQSVYSFY